MKLKKFTALIIVIAVVLSCFVGCKNKSNGWEIKVPETPLYQESNVISADTERLKVHDSENGSYLITLNAEKEGIIANDEQDDSKSIQTAIDKLSDNYGGGILYLPTGHYELSSSIVLKANCTILGDWAEPNENNGLGGTVIDIYYGRGVDSESKADAVIKMCSGARMENLSLYYPRQSVSNVRAYPYTVANNPSEGYYGSTIKNVTFVNCYRGIKINSANIFLFENVYMTTLYRGICVDEIWDISRMYDVNISPKYWAWADGSNTESEISSYTHEHATGIVYGKVDWIYMLGIRFYSLSVGFHFDVVTKANGDFGATGTTNGQFYDCEIYQSKTAVFVDMSSVIGLQFANCTFDTSGGNDVTVLASDEVNNMTSVQFTSCSFKAQGKIYETQNGKGIFTFNNCSFSGGSPMLYLNRGSYVFDNCSFTDSQNHVYIGEMLTGFKMFGCSFDAVYKEQLHEGFEKTANNYAKQDTGSEVASLNYSDDVRSKERYTPATSKVFYAEDYGAVADAAFDTVTKERGTKTIAEGATDNTKAIQHALNAAAKSGGGIVYLSDGGYYVKDYLVIPEGVLLRGVSNNHKHFGGIERGTSLITEYGKNDKGYAFITLKRGAGVSGLNVFYPDQNYLDNVKYTPTVLMSEDESYLYDMNFPNSYRAVYADGVKDIHLDFVRGFGLEYFMYINNSESIWLDNFLLTGAEWQDAENGNNVANAPDANHWKNYPNYENHALIIENSRNVRLFEIFSFGLGVGLELRGKTDNIFALGFGVDAARNSLVFNNVEGEATFINTQLVGVDSYVRTTKNFGGTLNMYNTNCWMPGMNVPLIFEGDGNVNVSQCHMVNGSIYATAGNVKLQNFICDGNIDHLIYSENVSGGMYNSVGNLLAFSYDYVDNDSFTVSNCTRR